MTLRAPSSSALATARTIPRSLKLPVGFWPSTFRWRLRRPMASPRRRAWTSGVVAEPRCVDERRRALAERDDGRGRPDGQDLAVALDEPGPGVVGRDHRR